MGRWQPGSEYVNLVKCNNLYSGLIPCGHSTLNMTRYGPSIRMTVLTVMVYGVSFPSGIIVLIRDVLNLAWDDFLLEFGDEDGEDYREDFSGMQE